MSTDLLEPLLTQIITSKKLSREAKKSILNKSGIQLTNQLNDLNDQGFTILGEMCKHDNRELILEWLINQGVDIEKGNPSRGQTPLAIASQYGNTNAMHILLEHDAKTSDHHPLKSQEQWDDGCIHAGKPPIYYAIRFGQVEAVELLIAFGALETSNTPSHLELISPNKHSTPLGFAREVLKAIQANKQEINRSMVLGNSKKTPTSQDLLKIIMIIKCAESSMANNSSSQQSEVK